MSVILHSKDTWGVCRCGHYDWQHSDFVYGGDGYDIIPRQEGHGKCCFEGCECEQFTWVKTIPHNRDSLQSSASLESRGKSDSKGKGELNDPKI